MVTHGEPDTRGNNAAAVSREVLLSKLSELRREAFETGTIPLSQDQQQQIDERSQRDISSLLSSPSVDSKHAEDLKKIIKEKHTLAAEKRVAMSALKDYIAEYRQLTSDANKAKQTRTKLENLCRQLSASNKDIRASAQKHIAEQEAHRKDLQKKFDDALENVNAKIEKSAEDRTNQSANHAVLQEKISEMLAVGQKQKEISDEITLQREREISALKTQVAGQHKRIRILVEERDMLKQKESLLMGQVESYSEKFEEVSKSMDSSQNLFKKLQQDISKTGHKNQKLRKQLVQKDLEIKKILEEAKKIVSEKEHLAGLCRALQDQVKAFRSASRETASAE